MSTKREWKPGDVALVTEYTEAGTRAVRVGSDCGTRNHEWAGDHWHYLDLDPQSGTWTSRSDAKASPLVVLDPEDRAQVARLLSGYYSGISGKRIAAEDSLVGDMQTALRSLLEPERPEEPTGLGAVVEGADGNRYVRVGPSLGDMHWRSADPNDSGCKKWQTVPAVRVLSEGVQGE